MSGAAILTDFTLSQCQNSNTPMKTSATEAARRIERGELTSEALVSECLERIAERDETVRAWAFVDRAHALAQAAAPGRRAGFPWREV